MRLLNKSRARLGGYDVQNLTDEKEKIIAKIIKLEEKMFVAVRSVEPAECQHMLKTFYVMRHMSHSVLSIDTLKSYFQDLVIAGAVGRNMITEKYARMDNLIPHLQRNEAIDDIISMETEWMQSLHEKYPLTVRFDENFANYAAGELETYSKHTLTLYQRDIALAYHHGINLVEQRYLILYQGMGFENLEAVEAIAKKRGVIKSAN
jgi:hypothetical protein